MRINGEQRCAKSYSEYSVIASAILMCVPPPIFLNRVAVQTIKCEQKANANQELRARLARNLSRHEIRIFSIIVKHAP